MASIEQVISAYKKYADQVEAEVSDVMESYARKIFNRSQYYCPVRDPERPDNPPPTGRPHNIPGGSLKQSGRVFKGEGAGEWIIGYGEAGQGTPRDPFYAVFVHEMPQAHVEPHMRDHYLSMAVAEIFPEMNQNIAREVGAGLRGFGQTTFGGVGDDGTRFSILAGAESWLHPTTETEN